MLYLAIYLRWGALRFKALQKGVLAEKSLRNAGLSHQLRGTIEENADVKCVGVYLFIYCRDAPNIRRQNNLDCFGPTIHIWYPVSFPFQCPGCPRVPFPGGIQEVWLNQDQDRL